MKRIAVDFHHVEPHHAAIHDRLMNWRRWVQVRPHGWKTHPMFRLYRSKRQYEVELHVPCVVDMLDALSIERAISRMPEKHRYAIRWSYVFGINAIAAAQSIGVSRQGLADLVSEARCMVKNTVPNPRVSVMRSQQNG